MDVYAFRHIGMEHLGSLAVALEKAGLHIHYIDLFADPSLHLDLHSATGLISLGGPMSANDNHDFLRRELGMLEAAIAEGKPVLGICLGSQLIARALGAPVYPAQAKEIGWGPVYRTDAGRIDPLVGSFHDPETVLHWHGETFDLPAGAIGLASSQVCPNQAFRFGTNVYGIQFHVEATPEMISEWSSAEVNRRDVEALGQPIDPHAHAPRMQELAVELAGRWAGAVVAHSAAGA